MPTLPTNRTTVNTAAEHVTDHNALHTFYNLTSGGATRGNLGYAQVTASQGSITAEADLTGLSVTVSVNSGERIRITGHCAAYSGSGATSEVGGLYVKESTTLLSAARVISPNASMWMPVHAEVILTPSAGSHTYKLAFARENGSGTWTMVAASNLPAFILVEGIGI